MPEHVIPSLTPRVKEDVRSCANCPMYTLLGSGSSVCGAKTIPLTLSGWDSTTKELALNRLASSCSEYGTTIRASGRTNQDWLELKRPPVIFPTGRSKTRDTIPRLSMTNFSCKKCKHFIPVNYLRGELTLDPNMFAGVCASKGIAIPVEGHQLLAGECLTYEAGEFPLEGVLAIKLGPDYSSAFLQKRAGIKLSHLPDDFDPLTFKSELPVTQANIDSGIRAWVGIKDKKTTNRVYLPIFNPTYFPSEEQVKIPSSDDETLPGSYVDHAGLVYKVAVAWAELDETPALIGEAGNGKTELLRHIAWIMQLPFERITITASSEVDDLAGKFLFMDGETQFQYGRLAKAWGKPNVICLDEPNTGPNDVLQFIRPLIDNSKQLVLDQNNGEQIMRDLNCFLGLAMNPSYDFKNIGANPMADADNSRLLHLEVPLPPAIVEREIIKARVLAKDNWEIPDVLLDSIFAIADTLRTMSKNDEVPFSWGLRVQIKVARLLKFFDFHDAYLMAMGSSVDPDTQQKVIAVVRANTPAR